MLQTFRIFHYKKLQICFQSVYQHHYSFVLVPGMSLNVKVRKLEDFNREIDVCPVCLSGVSMFSILIRQAIAGVIKQELITCEFLAL